MDLSLNRSIGLAITRTTTFALRYVFDGATLSLRLGRYFVFASVIDLFIFPFDSKASEFNWTINHEDHSNESHHQMITTDATSLILPFQ